MKQTIWFLISLVILLSGLSFVGCQRTRDEVKIAIVVGRGYTIGAELAAEEINSHGGIRGRKLVLDIDYSTASSDATTAINSAMQIAKSRDILAVVGHATSSPSLAAAQIYNEAGIVQIVPMATNPLVTQAGPWTFRICINDIQQGRLLADYVFDSLKKRKAFIFQVSDDYGKGLNYYFRKRFIERGGDVLYQAIYTQEETDFNPYVELMRQLAPDIILFAGRIREFLKARQQMEALGIKVPVIGGDALYSGSNIREKKEYSEGLMLTLFFNPEFETPTVKAFVENFRKRFGSAPDARAALTYDAVYLLKAAIEQNGPSRDGIRRYLSLVGSTYPPFQGVTGSISFDEKRDSIKPFQVGVVKNGEVRLAEK